MILEEEKREYAEFMAKLCQKKYELQYDFENLSYNNKIRVNNFTNQFLATTVLNFLTRNFTER